MHRPVLTREVVDRLGVRPGGRYLDATLGGGGHAEAILEASAPDGRLLGVDADPAAVARTRERLARFGARADCLHDRFSNLGARARERGFAPADGAVMDLGVSSFQLDDPERGFSFRADGPLDMRMDPGAGPTAADLVNTLPEAELADVLWRWGEERRSRRIARALCTRRARAPFTRTADLAEVIAAAAGGRRGPRHPATRSFQALRIAVNAEPEELEAGLESAWNSLGAGGRLAVIAFHSLEDRVVKQFFKARAETGAARLETRKPVRPSEDEVRENPRARSARLRVAENTQPCADFENG